MKPDEQSKLRFRSSPLEILVPLVAMVVGGILAYRYVPLGLEAIYNILIRDIDASGETQMEFSQPFPLVSYVVFGALLLGFMALYMQVRAHRLMIRWTGMGSADRITWGVAVLVGVAISIPFHMLAFAFSPYAVWVSVLLMLILIGTCTALLRSMQDVLPWSTAGDRRRANIKIFDTNIIIDGRIEEIVKAGFLEGKIYIPQFIVSELQLVADSADSNKRQRGRRGLDMLKILQADFEVVVGDQDHLVKKKDAPVDEQLVELARALGGQLVTNDFNLNKAASVQGVQVLNVNDLALALRPVFLPGDAITIKIERAGSQQGQGVGFLEDGTMVVVEHAEPCVGSEVEAIVTQIHQSAAGRMIFAGLDSDDGILEGRQQGAR